MRLEHDRALYHVVQELISDHTELFKQFSGTSSFKHWLTEWSSTQLVARARCRRRLALACDGEENDGADL
ncbi:MAG: hypothetical protein WBG44_13545 [Comamonas sp.]